MHYLFYIELHGNFLQLTPSFVKKLSFVCRFGLPDSRREGIKLVKSPLNHFIIATDHFGRVMIVDGQLGYIIRVWKGLVTITSTY